MATKVSEHFDIKELVSKALYNKWGATKSKWFVPQTAIQTLEDFRAFCCEMAGEEVTITVNNWCFGGDWNYRGFRDKTWSGSSSSDSFHKQARAWDVNVYVKRTNKMINCDTIRDWMVEHSKRMIAIGITTIEDGDIAKTWVHFDGRNTGFTDKLLVVKP